MSIRATLVIAAMSVGLFAFVAACDAPADDEDVTGDGAAVMPGPYRAVLVADSPDWKCGAPSEYGADIDAVRLSTTSGAHVDWFAMVRGEVSDAGETCSQPQVFTELDAAVGAADAQPSAGYVTLAGGWIIGEFTGAPRLEQHHVVTVHEVGSEVGSGGLEGRDEPFLVYLATDAECAGPDRPCALFVGECAGGECDVPLLDTGI